MHAVTSSMVLLVYDRAEQGSGEVEEGSGRGTSSRSGPGTLLMVKRQSLGGGGELSNSDCKLLMSIGIITADRHQRSLTSDR